MTRFHTSTRSAAPDMIAPMPDFLSKNLSPETAVA
jgi:hypothetical protein